MHTHQMSRPDSPELVPPPRMGQQLTSRESVESLLLKRAANLPRPDSSYTLADTSEGGHARKDTEEQDRLLELTRLTTRDRQVSVTCDLWVGLVVGGPLKRRLKVAAKRRSVHALACELTLHAFLCD